jgi:preprotein translocase subunit SecG
MMYIYWDVKNTKLVVSYFVSLILFGVFFILNLFLAVISDSFTKEQQKEKNIAFKQE